MRSAAAALIAFPVQVLAHPGHGALEGHLHGLGPEHGLLLAVIVGLLAYAARK